MEFINEPFVSYFVASDYVEVVCIKSIKKYGMGLKTIINITGERGSPWNCNGKSLF